MSNWNETIQEMNKDYPKKKFGHTYMEVHIRMRCQKCGYLLKYEQWFDDPDGQIWLIVESCPDCHSGGN